MIVMIVVVTVIMVINTQMELMRETAGIRINGDIDADTLQKLMD